MEARQYVGWGKACSFGLFNAKFPFFPFPVARIIRSPLVPQITLLPHIPYDRPPSATCRTPNHCGVCLAAWLILSVSLSVCKCTQPIQSKLMCQMWFKVKKKWTQLTCRQSNDRQRKLCVYLGHALLKKKHVRVVLMVWMNMGWHEKSSTFTIKVRKWSLLCFTDTANTVTVSSA